jgi:hypothetical protein
MQSDCSSDAYFQPDTFAPECKSYYQLQSPREFRMLHLWAVKVKSGLYFWAIKVKSRHTNRIFDLIYFEINGKTTTKREH